MESDFKEYFEGGVHFGIGQAEVVTLEDVPEVKDELLAVIGTVRMKKSLDWVLLLISDVMKGESILLSSGFEAGEKKLIYKKTQDNEFYLPGILSRKKQVLPEILRVVEELELA